MATLSFSHLNIPSLYISTGPSPFATSSFSLTPPFYSLNRLRPTFVNSILYCTSYRYDREEDEGETFGLGFEDAVKMFNGGDYYECHDVLERMWYSAHDPTRTLLHGVLQCSVGFHHLFNSNHKGAMMELGEGLCKLRKMNFESGPFFQFEREISAVLDFIYQTQLELAACSEDLCLTLDQSERSYELLGKYAAGEKLYSLKTDMNGIMHIIFSPERYKNLNPPVVKLPVLLASDEHLKDIENDGRNW